MPSANPNRRNFLTGTTEFSVDHIYSIELGWFLKPARTLTKHLREVCRTRRFLSVRMDNNQPGVTAHPFQPGSLHAHFVNGRAPIGSTVGAESPNLESVKRAGSQIVEQSAILRIGQHANGPGVRIRRAFFR